MNSKYGRNTIILKYASNYHCKKIDERVDIKTQGQENCQATAILTILASGENCNIIYFKAQEGKHTENDC